MKRWTKLNYSNFDVLIAFTHKCLWNFWSDCFIWQSTKLVHLPIIFTAVPIDAATRVSIFSPATPLPRSLFESFHTLFTHSNSIGRFYCLWPLPDFTAVVGKLFRRPTAYAYVCCVYVVEKFGKTKHLEVSVGCVRNRNICKLSSIMNESFIAFARCDV